MQDFPGSTVIKTLPSSVGGVGSIPGLGAKITQDSQLKKMKGKTEAILLKKIQERL